MGCGVPGAPVRATQSPRAVSPPHNTASFTGTTYTMASGYTRGMGNVRYSGSSHYFASVAYDFRFRNSTGETLSSSPTNFTRQYASGFTNAFLRGELPTAWRTILNFDYQSANRFTNVNSVESTYQYSYDTAFTTLLSQGELAFCNFAPPSCGSQKISTYHPIAVAYDEAVSLRTIYAWVNATRLNSSTDHMIYLAVGQRGTNELLLNEVISTGVQSSTNVAVACGPYGAANGYDCILVYTPLSSTTYGLRLKRFWVGGSADDYYIYFDPTETAVGWLTGSSPTAWYNDGWYIAHHAGTGVQVRKSASSTSWSHSQTLAEAVGTPRAVSVGKTSNRETRLYFTAP